MLCEQPATGKGTVTGGEQRMFTESMFLMKPLRLQSAVVCLARALCTDKVKRAPLFALYLSLAWVYIYLAQSIKHGPLINIS